MCVVIKPDRSVTIMDDDGRPQMNNSVEAFADHVRVAMGPGRLTMGAVTLSAPGYDVLGAVLMRAFDQAASGKGAQRHGQGQAFDEQPMMTIASLVGIGGPLFQAMKKAQEAQRLPRDAAVHELLGAINYLAGAIIHLESQE
ncbi:hypothetical protein [Bradyrhizobium sp. 613_E4_N2_2]|uniref:hypothetical protein n=1 Tax=Bradyrhizobium sp. 613_E4_N2_2 TaxID=3240371 RepID=UPI003F8A24EF